MSLTVSADLLDAAQRGAVSTEEFIACVEASLPYPFQLVARLADERSMTDRAFADNTAEPPDETAQGQLLRAMSSDAIRAALERHFGVTIAFQNCHRVAVFAADPRGSAEYQRFISVEAQLLNQRPDLVNC